MYKEDIDLEQQRSTLVSQIGQIFCNNDLRFDNLFWYHQHYFNNIIDYTSQHTCNELM